MNKIPEIQQALKSGVGHQVSSTLAGILVSVVNINPSHFLEDFELDEAIESVKYIAVSPGAPISYYAIQILTSVMGYSVAGAELGLPRLIGFLKQIYNENDPQSTDKNLMVFIPTLLMPLRNVASKFPQVLAPYAHYLEGIKHICEKSKGMMMGILPDSNKNYEQFMTQNYNGLKRAGSNYSFMDLSQTEPPPPPPPQPTLYQTFKKSSSKILTASGRSSTYFNPQNYAQNEYNSNSQIENSSICAVQNNSTIHSPRRSMDALNIMNENQMNEIPANLNQAIYSKFSETRNNLTRSIGDHLEHGRPSSSNFENSSPRLNNTESTNFVHQHNNDIDFITNSPSVRALSHEIQLIEDSAQTDPPQVTYINSHNSTNYNNHEFNITENRISESMNRNRNCDDDNSAHSSRSHQKYNNASSEFVDLLAKRLHDLELMTNEIHDSMKMNNNLKPNVTTNSSQQDSEIEELKRRMTSYEILIQKQSAMLESMLSFIGISFEDDARLFYK